MRRYVLFLTILSLTLLASRQAEAVSLNLVPVNQTVEIGETATVELVISGLGLGTPDSLSRYDIDITYDNTSLDLDFGGITQDTSWALGGPHTLTEFPSFINATGDSFAPFIILDAIQADTFTLLEIPFKGLTAGTSFISGDLFVLLDGFGIPLISTFGPVGSASITVNAPIPEPTTITLLGIGLAGLAGVEVRRRRKKKAVDKS